MKRRKFIQHIAAGSIAPILLNGIPISAFASNSPLMRMLAASQGDRILVLLQMHGGNDGLNTLIPIYDYSTYYSTRANIAIEDSGSRKYIQLDPALPTDEQVGLHPDMTGVKELYDGKRASVVHAVGYENMNMSHFRGRDIWFMGGDFNDKLPSGWMGRFLDETYPGYPDSYPNQEMLDPLGLEMGFDVSSAFTRENSIPAGLSIPNPQAFYDLINSIGIEPPTALSFPDSPYGRELEYLVSFEKKSHDYALRLKEVYDAGSNSPNVTYPTIYPLSAPSPYKTNYLAEQFKIIARLIKGGIKTRVFLTRITGFDTHADQVESASPSQGRHAALLYHVSESVKAFHNDLKDMGLEEKVLTMTYSEFGRRVYSNASYGTDHGKAAPILLFGSGLKGSVIGSAPDLSDLDNGNLKYQFDYRQLYTSVLSDWLGSDDAAIRDSGLGDFLHQKLDLFVEPLKSNGIRKPEFNGLGNCYPNPADDYTTVTFELRNYSKIKLSLFNNQGMLIKSIINKFYEPGYFETNINLSGISAGKYIILLEANGQKASRVVIKK